MQNPEVALFYLLHYNQELPRFYYSSLLRRPAETTEQHKRRIQQQHVLLQGKRISQTQYRLWQHFNNEDQAILLPVFQKMHESATTNFK